VSASRIRQAVVVLSKALDAARRDNLIATNPARGVDRPTLDRREARFLEPAVVAAIVDAAPAPYDLAIRMLGTLGLRFGELAALRRDDVDVLRRRLRIDESLTEVGGRLVLGSTKTHTERTVPLAPSIAAALAAHLADVPDDPTAFVFTMPGGGPLGYSNFRRRVWLPALHTAGVEKIGVHALRHSAAAALISGGSSPKDVQTVLGHRSAGFTLTVYGHLFESDLDAIGDRMEAALAYAQTGTRRAAGSDGVVLEHPRAR
jgi:integrase